MNKGGDPTARTDRIRSAQATMRITPDTRVVYRRASAPWKAGRVGLERTKGTMTAHQLQSNLLHLPVFSRRTIIRCLESMRRYRACATFDNMLTGAMSHWNIWSVGTSGISDAQTCHLSLCAPQLPLRASCAQGALAAPR